jgi:hypothetical protein
VKVVYYVVYEAWYKGKSMGRGSCEATRERNIESIEDINEIEEAIKEDKDSLKDYNLQVINFIALRVE